MPKSPYGDEHIPEVPFILKFCYPLDFWMWHTIYPFLPGSENNDTIIFTYKGIEHSLEPKFRVR